MEFKSLRLFVAIAETGSFARAAEHCHTVQSNVTAHIKKLEAGLGARLFVRSRQLSLTPAGQTFLRHACELLKAHDAALAAVRTGAEPGGTLSIGAMETTAAVRLPAVLSAYHRVWPEVNLQLTTGTTAELTDRLLDGTLDCVFIAGGAVQARLHSIAAFTESLVLVSDQPMTALPGPDQLAGTPFMAFRQGCHYRQRIELLLAEHGVTHGRIFEFGTVDGILGCVSAGMGYALLPQAVVARHQGRLALHTCPVPEPIGRVTTYLAAPKSEGWSPALTAFVDAVQAQAERKRASVVAA